MRSKQFQAKHIEDKAVLAVLAVIDTLIRSEYDKDLAVATAKGHPEWAPKLEHITASRWDIVDALKPIPWKIVQAKLASMKKRGLIDGCVGCTCRGSFVRSKG